jgi:hypothetical protein
MFPGLPHCPDLLSPPNLGRKPHFRIFVLKKICLPNSRADMS